MEYVAPLYETLFQFDIPIGDYRLEPVKIGHINKTYFARSGVNRFVLQQVNHHVFPDVEGLMANIMRATEALHGSAAFDQAGLRVPRFIQTREGNSHHTDEQGQYWRLMDYIDGKSFDIVPSPTAALKGGRAFGAFIEGLMNENPNHYVEVIPRFHSFEKRYNDLLAAIAADAAGRAKDVQREIEFFTKRADNLMTIPKLIASGQVPTRITHNDTKFNNVLFNGQGDAVAIVDLDTIMPGTVLFDFGDAMRSATNVAAEDEKDLSKVTMNRETFKAYTEGYLSVLKNKLTRHEIELLPKSARLMTAIIGIRFLSDHLNGDVYYATAYPGHNLVRARTQIKLTECFEQQMPALDAIVSEIITTS